FRRDERDHDGPDAEPLSDAHGAAKSAGRGVLMKATLYQFATSPFCSKVRKILDYKGFDYQVVEVDYAERKELIAASGQIMVPALRIEIPGSSGAETVVDSHRIAL